MSLIFLSILALQAQSLPIEMEAWSSKPTQHVLKAARHGDMEAQYEIGRRYELGLELPKSRKKAIQWYLKAAHFHTERKYLYFQPTERNPIPQMVEIGSEKEGNGLPLARSRLSLLLSSQAAARDSGGDAEQGSAQTQRKDVAVNYTPAVRLLLEAAGVNMQSEKFLASQSQSVSIDIKGFRGSLRIRVGKCGHEAGFSNQAQCEVPSIGFFLPAPVSRCIKLEEVERFVQARGWVHIPHEQKSPLKPGQLAGPLILKESYKDNYGSTLNVEPNIGGACINIVEIVNPNGRRD